jgi:hypothetical protein
MSDHGDASGDGVAVERFRFGGEQPLKRLDDESDVRRLLGYIGNVTSGTAATREGRSSDDESRSDPGLRQG